MSASGPSHEHDKPVLVSTRCAVTDCPTPRLVGYSHCVDHHPSNRRVRQSDGSQS